LEKSGRASAIMSEDTDLFIFGAKIVLYKWDGASSSCIETNFTKVKDIKLGKSMSFDGLCTVCILSGCDYLDRIPGIGLKRAAMFLDRAAGDLKEALKLIFSDDDAGAEEHYLKFQYALRGFREIPVNGPNGTVIPLSEVFLDKSGETFELKSEIIKQENIQKQSLNSMSTISSENDDKNTF